MQSICIVLYQLRALPTIAMHQTKSCFDTDGEREADSNTNPTDDDAGADANVKGEDDLDISWIIEEDKDHPPRILPQSRRGV
jgi:hypothetical protein